MKTLRMCLYMQGILLRHAARFFAPLPRLLLKSLCAVVVFGWLGLTITSLAVLVKSELRLDPKNKEYRLCAYVSGFTIHTRSVKSEEACPMFIHLN